MSLSFMENICSEIGTTICNDAFLKCVLVVTVYPDSLVNSKKFQV